MSENPWQGTLNENVPVTPPKNNFWHNLAGVLVLLAIVGVVISLVMPPEERKVLGSAKREQCRDNLKHIALAMHNYSTDYKSLPPAYTVDAKGKPLHSWRTLLLPYLEQKNLYDKIDLTKPWNDPVNLAVGKTELHIYRCPSLSSDCPHDHTTYKVIVSPESAFPGIESRKLSDITDGLSNTLLVVEAPSNKHGPWMAPDDLDPATLLSLERYEQEAKQYVPHNYGIQIAFADGSVHFILLETKRSVLQACMTIAGNDNRLAEQK